MQAWLLRALAAFTATIVVTSPSLAGPPGNPELTARDLHDRSEDPRPIALRISRLGAKVEIVGDVARTSILVRFDNPDPKDEIEGDFTFDLPPQSVITGYALDIDGKMVDGVLIGARKAKLVYDARVRRGVDPGIAEVTRSNAFRTHVYPIMPKSGRTIRLDFVTPIAAGHTFSLPLTVPDPVSKVALDVTYRGRTEAPALGGPTGITLTWSHESAGYHASARATNRTLAGAISVGPIATARSVVAMRSSDGEAFFEINDSLPAPVTAKPARLRVYWDTSRSHRDSDLKRELDLLHRYLAVTKPTMIDLVLFADRKPMLRSFASAAEAEAALTDIAYRGATSLKSVIAAAMILPPADSCLLFSDGRVTLGSYSAQNLGCSLAAISSAADADRGFLSMLAERSAGDYFDLTATDTPEALARMMQRSPHVTSVTRDGESVDAMLLGASGNRLRLVGPGAGHVVVGLSDGTRRSYDAPHPAEVSFNSLAALWAGRHIVAMQATDRPNREDALALARRYSVATPGASFVVLETGSDYAEAGVEPPATLPTKILEAYADAVALSGKQKATAQDQRAGRILNEWAELKLWWATDFRAHPFRQPGSKQFASAPPPPPPSPNTAQRVTAGHNETVVVTAERRAQDVQTVPLAVTTVSSESRDADGSDVSVTIAPWNPDRPYLKALEATDPANFWKVFADQERSSGTLPAFYLDVAEYLFRHGRAGDAIEVALSAIDLSTADDTTLTIVADRLMRYGDIEHALWIYDRLVFLEPDRPQPLRNLALALIGHAERLAKGDNERREDFARALVLLHKVVSTPWSSAYDGIELISLVEANRVIPRAKALGVDIPFAPELVALLAFDVRVTLEWNVDEVDMDLWVDQPDGERAIYSNQKTAIGGLLSNDMTNGYGPEEYLLRRAPNGTYTIQVNTYRSDVLNPNGPTTIHARLFRNYGRPDQSDEAFDIEMKPKETDGARNDKGLLIGTFKVTSARK